MSPAALYVLSPLKTKTSSPQTLDASKVFDFRSGSWDPEDIVRWVTKSSKVSFSLHVPLTRRVLRYKWHAAAAVAGLVGLVGLGLAIKNRMGPRHPMFWYWACIGVWMSVCGGTHFCILRGSPLYMVHPRTKEVTLFHPSAKSQYLAEGFIATGLELTGGILLVILTQHYPRMTPGVTKRLTGYTLTAAFFTAVYGMRKLYFTKQGWK